MARARAQSILDDSKGKGGGGGGEDDGEEAQVLNRCLVFARMRPTKPGEIDPRQGMYQLIKFEGGGKIMLDDEKTYNFDGTFGQSCVNADVYLGVGKPTVDHVMKGYTAAILAYGQTGTGKSFTMSNFKPGLEGVIPLSVGYLLERIEKDTSRSYSLRAQFVQIYRDNLSDLMTPEDSKVDVRFDQKDGVQLIGCQFTKIESKADFNAMYSEGDSRRVVRATLMNPESSRGHTALVMHIESQPKGDAPGGKRKGKLTFIDLAGYERFAKTGISGDPVCKDEAKTINASLLSLGHVVSALSQGEKHIPWRNSKLTRLLQDSIGGRSRTTILIMLGPSSDHLHESTNSLDFGNRAMDVKVAAKLEENVDFERLAKKLQEMLAQEKEKVNKLELEKAARLAELADRTKRFKADIDTLRDRHKSELTKLLEEGATPDRIQALLKQHEVESEVLQEQQDCERSIMEETNIEQQDQLVREVEREHRVREQSLKAAGQAQVHEVKARDAQLRAACQWLSELQSGREVSEIAEELKRRTGDASPISFDEDEDPASPRTAAGVANAIDRRELDELKQKLEATETKSKEQIEKMKRAQLKLAENNKGLKKKLEELETAGGAASAASAAEIDRLQGALGAEKQAKEAAQAECDSLHAQVTEQREKLHRAEASAHQSGQELEGLRKEHEATAAAKDEAEKAAAERQETIQQIQASRKELKGKMEALEQQLAEEKEEFHRRDRERTAQKEEQAQEGARRIEELEGASSDLRKQISGLEAEISELKAANAELAEQLSAKSNELDELKQRSQEDRDTAATQLAAAKAESEEKVREARDEKGSFEAEAQRLREALQRAEEEFQKQLLRQQKLIEDTQQRAEDEKAALREEAEGVRSRADEAQGKHSDAEAQLQAAAAAAAAAKLAHEAALDEERAATKAARDETGALSDALEKEKAASAELQQQLDASRAEGDARAAEMRSRDADVEGERQRSKEALEASERSKQELQEELKELEQASAQAMEELESQVSTLQAAKEEALEQLAAEQASHAKEVEETKRIGDQEIGRLEEQLSSARADLTSEREKGADELAAERATLQRDLQSETERSGGLQEEIERLKAADMAAALEKGQLKARVAELEREGVEREAQREAAEEADEEQRKLVAELQNDLDEARDGLVSEVKQREQDAAKAAEREAALESELEALREGSQRALDEHELALAEAKEEGASALEAMRAEHTEQAEAADAELHRLQSELDLSREEIAAHEEMIEALEQRVQELEAELAQMKGEAGAAKTEAQQQLEEMRKLRTEHQKQLAEGEEERRRKEELEAQMAQQRGQHALSEKELQERLEEERARARGKFKYKSQVVSRMVEVSQMQLPKEAPQLLRSIDILANLQPEEFKHALRYHVYIIGAEHSGKSSVARCVTTERTPKFKKIPSVETPTTGINSTAFTVKEEKSGGGYFSKKEYHITHYQVWDMPGDLRFLSVLPPKFYAVKGSCFFLCYFINREFGSECRRMEEALLRVAGACKHRTDKLSVCLFATRKDLLPGALDAHAVHAKVTEVVAWFNELPVAKEHFNLLGAYACSAKDWTVQSETGKEGPGSFPSVMRHLSRQLHRLYPNTPPALLMEEQTYGSGASLAFEDWWEQHKDRRVQTDEERVTQKIHRSMISLVVTMDRHHRRANWLMGEQEFQWTLEEHFDSDLLSERPTVFRRARDALLDRGLVLPVGDPQHADSQQERVVVLTPTVVSDLVSTLMQPYLYLSLVERWAAERPGHLKELFIKQGFFVDKVKREEWDSLFDGRMSQSLAGLVLHRTGPAFGNDRTLMLRFLNAMGVGYRLPHAGPQRTSEFYSPCTALRTMSPPLESAVLGCFEQHGGNTSATLPLRHQPLPVLGAVLREGHRLAAESSWLWSNAVVGRTEKDVWFAVHCCSSRGVSVCAAKSPETVSTLKAAVGEALSVWGLSELEWVEGMALDDLPALPPQVSKIIRESSDVEAALEALPLTFLRGADFPRSLDVELHAGKGKAGLSPRSAAGASRTPKAGWTSPRGSEASKVAELASWFGDDASAVSSPRASRRPSAVPAAEAASAAPD